jgi:hypothetical protein
MLTHILGIPLGPSFVLRIHRLSLQSPWAVAYKSIFPQGKMIVHILDAAGSSLMMEQQKLRFLAVAYVKPSSSCSVILIFGMG